MSKGRIAILCLMWSVTLTLFVIAATGAKRAQEPANGAMTGSETGFQTVESASDVSGTPFVRVNGCLSESELAALFAQKLDGILGDITVTAGTDILTLRGVLTADEETILEKYPSLQNYALILRLADGAPVEVGLGIVWQPDAGFHVTLEKVAVFDIAIPTKELSSMAEKLQTGLNQRGVALTVFEISRWELAPGGLYYSAVLPDEDSVRLLYPVI